MKQIFPLDHADVVVHDKELLGKTVALLEEGETIADFNAKFSARIYRPAYFVIRTGKAAERTGEELLGAEFYYRGLSGDVYARVVDKMECPE